MAGLVLKAFGGYSPRIAPHLLQDNEATKAVNTKLYSGSLDSWYKPGELTPRVLVDENTRSIYRVRKTNGDDLWFAWNTDVNVAKGPLFDTQSFRIYYTGDGGPKKTNEALAGSPSGSAPEDYLSLGVPEPSAPSVARVGTGTNNAETRIYAVTHISTFGDIKEESAPSQASGEVTLYTGDSVTVTLSSSSGTYSQTDETVTITETAHGLTTGMRVYLDFTSGTAVDGWYDVTVVDVDTYTVTQPTDSTSGNVIALVKAPAGRYNITHLRIYRSVTGSASTQFQFVDEVALGTLTYSDTKSSAQLGEVLKTSTWTLPPENLKGLVEMPNGILAGFINNEVHFSEPYYPHAWPVEYTVSVDQEIVGLGAFGQSVVVMTKGNPYIISGVASANMSSEKIAIIEPCISARSIVSDSLGVTYASPNGLIEIGPGGPNLITQNVLLREQFIKLSPSTSIGVSTQGRYFMFYESAVDDIVNGCLVFDRRIPATPLSQVSLDASTAWVDQEDAQLYIVERGEIYLWEGDVVNALPYEWISKDFILPEPVNFGALEVYADFGSISTAELLQQQQDQIAAENQQTFNVSTTLKGEFNEHRLNQFELNGSILESIPQTVEDRFVLVIVYADGEEKQRITLTERGAKRLIAGYKSDTYRIAASGNIPLRHIKIAETVRELKAL
jgi:hypothetical protein